jgi:hypothetical protein
MPAISSRRQDPLGAAPVGPPKDRVDRDQPVETLVERVNRMKARWLKRVMYDSPATSTEKCFAYVVADHLNCVTLDCWPGQDRLVALLGRKNIKTAQRAARRLERLGVLTLNGGGLASYRYAPVFMPGDEDKAVTSERQHCPPDTDKNVDQSLLRIHSKESSPTGLSEGRGARNARAYDRRQRGAIELQVAAMLGNNGMGILCRIAARNDAAVDRLCRAHAEGRLGERELAAARLAAEQMR